MTCRSMLQVSLPMYDLQIYVTSKPSNVGPAQARIQDFLQWGVNDGRVERAPLAPAPTRGLGLINIRLRYIASIEYSERFFVVVAIVKKFVEKKIGGREQGGVTTPPDPRLLQTYVTSKPSNVWPADLSYKWAFQCRTCRSKLQVSLPM